MLYKRRFNHQQTYDMLISISAINKEIMPCKFGPNCMKLLESGFMYIGGRDRHYRPYIVFRPAIMLNAKPEAANAITCILTTVTFIRHFMMAHGSVENLVTIVSQEGVSMWNMNITLMRSLIRVISNVVAGRARQMFILNTVSIFSMIFKVASNFLDENTINKLQVTTANTSPILQALIAPEQLEERFGGKAPDRKDGEYWPPRIPADTFGIEGRQVVTSTTGNAA